MTRVGRVQGPFPRIHAVVFAVLAGIGLLLTADLAAGRKRIVAERSALAIQQSQFMSQWFGTAIVAADYVLRDINGRVTAADLDAAPSDATLAARLTTLVRDKLATLPAATGITLYDRDCVFVVAADPRVLGFRSNQKACTDPNPQIEDRTYIQYIPAEKSASKRPVILVSRHLLSPEGRFLGGALVAIDLAFAQEWIETFSAGDRDVLAVVDGEGILLARNPPLPEAVGTRTPPPPGQPPFGDQRASVSFQTVSPLDGRERIYGLSKIENVPLVIIVGFDLAESLSEWHRRAGQLLAGFLALLAVSLLALRAYRTALAQREELRKLATTDPLTGVANRRHLTETGEHEMERALRYQGRLALIMVDIDHFKAINDTWGHPTGDRVIQALAAAMTETLRKQDLIGRLGGEEFAAVLPETDADGAAALAERLRLTVEQAVVVTSDDGREVRFTLSAGVAALRPGDTSFEALLGRADQALYAAKGGGRNRVTVA